MSSVIELKNLKKYYGESRGIEDVSLNIEEGTIYGFIGPNGEGKTTLLNALRDGLIESGSATVKYVGQTDGERGAACDETLVEHVLMGDDNRAKLSEEVERLSLQESLSPEDAERLGEAMAELEADGGKDEKDVLKPLFA